jgi:hypothetical protein
LTELVAGFAAGDRIFGFNVMAARARRTGGRSGAPPDFSGAIL